MADLLRLLLAVLDSLFKSRAELEAEILVLRQQVNVLRRRMPKRPALTNIDRLLFVWLYRWFPSTVDALAIVRPETVIRWHRGGFRAYWRWRSRSRVGRPKVSTELRALIRQMGQANPLWGAPRIHGELLKLGFDVAQSTVAKYIVRRRGPPSQGWKTFLRIHAPDIGAIDLFIVPTVGFRLLYGLVIITLQRRQLVWTNATANPTADWIARRITEAFPWEQAPRYLIRDRDASYGHAVTRRLAAMGIRDRPTAPRSPWQNGHAERLIGSIRRECLDPVVILGEVHLRRILAIYASYYNEQRTHRSLAKDSPLHRVTERLGTLTSRTLLGGLHHQYCRIQYSVHTSAVVGFCLYRRRGMVHKGHGNQENARPMTAITNRQEIVLAALATEPGARVAPVHGLPEPRSAG
jgi:transposase InsO family protein